MPEKPSEPVPPLPWRPEPFHHITETLFEIHRILAIIDESRAGELQEPFYAAWVSGSRNLRQLTGAVSIPRPDLDSEETEVVNSESSRLNNFEEHGLAGPEGWLKRIAWSLRYNRFLGLLKTAPRTPEALDAARREGTLALDLGAIVVGSVSKSPTAKAVGELLGVTKHALDLALYRPPPTPAVP